MRLVVVSIVGLLVACETPPEQERADVLTAFCGCLHATPSAIETCKTDEVGPFVPAILSDECINCVYTNSGMCTDLFQDCADPCTEQPPQP